MNPCFNNQWIFLKFSFYKYKIELKSAINGQQGVTLPESCCMEVLWPLALEEESQPSFKQIRVWQPPQTIGWLVTRGYLQGKSIGPPEGCQTNQ